MNDKMTEAWALFEKAERFDLKARDATKTESMRNIASRARDKALDEACLREAEALA